MGRRSSFEVKVNGEEIHSKLKTMGFPDFQEVVEICQETLKGSPPTTVKKINNANVNGLIAVVVIVIAFFVGRYLQYF